MQRQAAKRCCHIQTRPLDQFENGLVLVNPGAQPIRIDIEAGYTHFRGKQAPQVNDGRPVKTILVAPGDGMLLVKIR